MRVSIKINMILFAFLILLVIPVAVAEQTYNNTGAVNQNFLVGTGIFNENLATSIVNSRSFSNSITNIPLVADLDSDGINEIIITVGNRIRILDTNLNSLALLTLETGTYTTPVIANIDNDTFSEIIIANQEQINVSILEWNGTDLVRQAIINVTIDQKDGAKRAMIACNDGEGGTEGIKCLLVSAVSDKNGANFESNVSAFLFNATTAGSLVFINQNDNTLCLPQIPLISVADYDADGRDEFIFSHALFFGGTNEILFLTYINDSFDLTLSVEQETTFSTRAFTTFNPISSALASCDDSSGVVENRHSGAFFTSPLVAELNGEAGMETIVGLNLDAQNFRIIVFDKNGNDIDQHPQLNTADGEIVGNAMLANVFGDTGNIEYCVLGHDDEENEGTGVLSLLCGSQQTGASFDSSEFRFNTDGRFNITKTFPNMNVIAHMGQHSNQNIEIAGEGLTDTTELISAYGVFRLNDNTFNGTVSVREMDLIFSSIVGDSACIVADAQKAGSEEIICIEDTVISYINDGVDNAPAEITAITYNPCVVDSTIKVNETLQVSVTVTDQNPAPLSQDTVFSNVTVYFEDGNEVSSSLGATASGQIHNHLFTLNKSGVRFAIRIQGWDSANPSSKNTEPQSFTVAINGIEFGDSTCTIDFVTVAEAEAEAVITEATLILDATDNSLTSGLNTFSGLTGLAGTTIWLLFMMLGAFFIYSIMAENGLTGNSALGTITIMEVLAILIGVRIGVFSTGLVVTIVVIGVVIIGLFLGRHLSGKSLPSE